MKKISSFTHVFLQLIPMHLIFMLTGLLPNCVPTIRLRGFLLRPFFKSCGRNLKISSGVIINNPDKIELGDNVFIANNAWINGVGGLVIGDNVLIGPMSVIVTSQHIYKDGRMSLVSKTAPVCIESDCWISSHVIVTDGTTIKRNSIVGAGAVVTKTVPSDSKVGGVPAKVLGVNLNE